MNQQPYLYPPSRRNVRGDILFAFAVAIGLYLAWLLRDILIVIYVSALGAVVLLPVVRGVQSLRIRNWRPGRGAAIVIIMVLFLGAAAAFMVFTIPPVIREVKDFVHAAPGRGPAYLQRLQSMPILRDMNFTELQTKLKQDLAQHAGVFVASISGWASKLLEIITGIILTIYFLAEGDHVYHWFLSLVPGDRRERLDGTLQRAGTRMGKWLLGQLALMLILGICSGIVFGAMRLPYAFALAVLMGAFNIIPVVGALVSTLIAMLVAVSSSWGKVLGIMIFELIYSQVENGFLIPRIMKTRVDLAGTAVFIALLLGVSLAGVAGALVAVPSAVLVAVLVEEYVIRPAEAAGEPDVVAAGSPQLR
jgi:predicted PurR-regulated permease PerM